MDNNLYIKKENYMTINMTQSDFLFVMKIEGTEFDFVYRICWALLTRLYYGWCSTIFNNSLITAISWCTLHNSLTVANYLSMTLEDGCAIPWIDWN